ncbi:MAG TPA: clostripain-related cysteine peptidase [Vicinamibacterales bacterium]|nr:clostripain-related cysteine peptidase [Vicinamibacterales bacterium]
MKSLSWLATAVVLSLFATSIAHAAPLPQARWTIMVYMSGDNNLEDYIVNDIEQELGLAGSNADVRIVALADRGPGYDTRRGDWQSTKFYYATQGIAADAASAVADWGERNFGNPQTLIDFVTYAKTNYPADRYVLYFWGHGWNWHPGWVMEDDTNVDTLDYHEMKAAIPQLGFIDVVGFDGCNMATLEIYKLWQNKATAVTASEEYVGWNGIEYDSVIAQLRANPHMSADQVAVATAQSAIALGGEKTWSAVAVDGRLAALLTATDQFAVALTNGLAANRKKYDRAFGATRSMWQAPMDKDLYDMAAEIQANVTDATIRSRAQAVMNAVTSVTLWEGHVNAYADVHGTTIYHISKASQKDSNYTYYRSTIDLALTTSWDEFLNAYAQ